MATRSAETVGSLAESSQTVHETKEEFQGMGSILGKLELQNYSLFWVIFKDKKSKITSDSIQPNS